MNKDKSKKRIRILFDSMSGATSINVENSSGTEVCNALSNIVNQVTKVLLTKADILDVSDGLTTACSVGIASALKENKDGSSRPVS